MTLTDRAQPHFDSIESGHEYVQLLRETIAEAKREIQADLEHAVAGAPNRQVEALRLVSYKLDKLEQHLLNSSRLLNDLRTLRRLLFEERAFEPASVAAGGRRNSAVA